MSQRMLHPLLPALLALLPLAALGHGDEEHGDHDARHGGFVLMYEDIHFEVAATPGAVQVYYSDGARNELPASIVSDVVVEIERPGLGMEYLTMAISAGGDFWEGSSAPIEDADTVVRVGFLYNGKPLMLSVPASALAALPPTQEAGAQHAGSHAGH